MDNYFIADQFALLSKLMDIHGENSFKSKSYSSAAFTIEKLPVQLQEIEREKIFGLKGIGESTGKKIIEILDKGYLSALEEYIGKTPPGVLEMMQIKGLGPKKISTIWKEMEIESMGELLYACNENRLARFKGFGAKTQENVKDSINFFLKHKGSHLYAEVEEYALKLQGVFEAEFGKQNISITGAFRRQMEIISELEWVINFPVEKLKSFLLASGFMEEEEGASFSAFRGEENILLKFYSVTPELMARKLFETSCSTEFLEEWNRIAKTTDDRFGSEEEIFQKASLPFLPPFQRDFPAILSLKDKSVYASPLEVTDIRGIIHSHSTWSDGSDSIEKMAEACIRKGYEYLVISDHSKSAFYANGLQEERIILQHEEIDALNQKLAPFRIFKSIESDILNDGSLDYSPEVLSSFDLVITSIHSNLKMSEEKAMSRLIKAIENPYTTILGHMTGRLLLSRPGYPVNHSKIIDACRANNVIIELNANPRRLDMDWRFIREAIDKGLMISIDPDAHDIAELDFCRYGVYVAQKAGLKKEQNLSSLPLKEMELKIRKKSG